MLGCTNGERRYVVFVKTLFLAERTVEEALKYVEGIQEKRWPTDVVVPENAIDLKKIKSMISQFEKLKSMPDNTGQIVLETCLGKTAYEVEEAGLVVASIVFLQRLEAASFLDWSAFWNEMSFSGKVTNLIKKIPKCLL